MDIDNLSEKELLKECVQENKEAWNTFVERYSNLIYHTINKTLKTYHADHLYQDSSDIHNNVFLSLMENNYRKLRQYKGRNGCTVSSCLMVVTSNFTLNFIKKQKQHIPIEDNNADNINVIKNISISQQPDEELSEKEYREVFKELINDLNANDMLFLKLYYEKELSPEEIAEILNLTVSTVYSKKNRIREKLQKISKKRNILQGN
mgnify:FL=1